MSFPKIISARSDDAVPTEPVWRRRSRMARRLVVAAYLCPNPGACACHCNSANTMSAPAANAVRQRSEHDPGSRAGASRSGAQHRGSARATSVRSDGPESRLRCKRHNLGLCRCTRSFCRAASRWVDTGRGPTDRGRHFKHTGGVEKHLAHAASDVRFEPLEGVFGPRSEESAIEPVRRKLCFL